MTIDKLIELLNEFNAPTTPQGGNAPNGTPPAPVPGKTFSEDQVEAVRAEEKKKLYGQLESAKGEAKAAAERARTLEDEVGKLRSQVKESELNKLPDDQKLLATIEEMKREGQEREARYREDMAKRDEEARQFQLQLYKEQRIRDLQADGIGVMDHLIGGNSREEIEASIAVAQAEYKLWEQRFYSRFQQQHPPAQQPQQLPPQVTPDQVAQQFAPNAQQQVPQQQPYQQVTGPTPTAPAPAPGSAGVDYNQIAQLTTQEAVRSGDYQKNRDVILARLRQGHPVGTGAVQLPMRPMPGNPQFQPGVPAQPTATTAPAPQMAYTQQPNGVMQPQGLPTPQVQNPAIAQHAGMGMPSAGYPQQQQPQYQQPVPQQQGADVAMRSQAAAAAANALSNPASAAASTGKQMHGPSGYGLPQTNPNAPTAQHLHTGVHPQIRGTG